MAKKANKSGASNANTDRAAAIAKAASQIKAADVTRLATSALASSTSRFALCQLALAFIGKVQPETPTYAARHAAARRAVGIGYLAGRFRRDGDNRPDDALLAYAGEVYSVAQWDAQKVDDKNGQRRADNGQKDGPETKARQSMRTYLSGLFGEAGIAAPRASGGSGQTDEQKAAKRAKALKEAKANPQSVIANIKSDTAQAAIKQLVANVRKADKEALALAPPAANDAEAFGEYAERMLVMLLQRADKVNAATNGAIPPQIGSALSDCKKAIAAARK